MSSATGGDAARRGRRRVAGRASPGPATATNVGPAAPDLDELGEDRERDLLGRLGAEVDAGRRPQRGEPLLGEAGLVAQPLPDGGARVGEATSPT